MDTEEGEELHAKDETISQKTVPKSGEREADPETRGTTEHSVDKTRKEASRVTFQFENRVHRTQEVH